MSGAPGAETAYRAAVPGPPRPPESAGRARGRITNSNVPAGLTAARDTPAAPFTHQQPFDTSHLAGQADKKQYVVALSNAVPR